MTLREFLEVVSINDHTDEAHYPDGSGGEDRYVIVAYMDGHGSPLDAEVTKITTCRGMAFIDVRGKHSHKQ